VCCHLLRTRRASDLNRLRNCVRHEDTVARIGGDEFVIVLEGLGETPAGATRSAIMTSNKVLAAMRDDFEIGEVSHRSSASLGVVERKSTRPKPSHVK